MKNCKGLWFCGLAGSGKTTAAKYLHKKKYKSLLIDGDDPLIFPEHIDRVFDEHNKGEFDCIYTSTKCSTTEEEQHIEKILPKIPT